MEICWNGNLASPEIGRRCTCADAKCLIPMSAICGIKIAYKECASDAGGTRHRPETPLKVQLPGRRRPEEAALAGGRQPEELRRERGADRLISGGQRLAIAEGAAGTGSPFLLLETAHRDGSDGSDGSSLRDFQGASRGACRNDSNSPSCGARSTRGTIGLILFPGLMRRRSLRKTGL